MEQLTQSNILTKTLYFDTQGRKQEEQYVCAVLVWREGNKGEEKRWKLQINLSEIKHDSRKLWDVERSLAIGNEWKYVLDIKTTFRSKEQAGNLFINYQYY